MENNSGLPEDILTQQIGVLVRREVEARILAPVIQAMGARFGEDEVREVLSRAIVDIARQQGADLARAMGGNSAAHFLKSLQFWMKDDALAIDILRNTSHELHFNVKRCRYAEMYQALGITDMGATLSCNRDFALIEGFNPKARLLRTQTLMEGAEYCDFRYAF